MRWENRKKIMRLAAASRDIILRCDLRLSRIEWVSDAYTSAKPRVREWTTSERKNNNNNNKQTNKSNRSWTSRNEMATFSSSNHHEHNSSKPEANDVISVDNNNGHEDDPINDEKEKEHFRQVVESFRLYKWGLFFFFVIIFLPYTLCCCCSMHVHLIEIPFMEIYLAFHSYNNFYKHRKFFLIY